MIILYFPSNGSHAVYVTENKYFEIHVRYCEININIIYPENNRLSMKYNEKILTM